jgi:WD40 repeat protein
VTFSPDGKTAVTRGDDGTARIWDPLTGKDIMVFKGHTDFVAGVAFSPDGSARLWDVATGTEVRRFIGHTNLVRDVVFSPDGKYILTASHDTTARPWFTDYRDTLRYICSLLPRDFTDEERIEYGISDQHPTCPAQ